MVPLQLKKQYHKKDAQTRLHGCPIPIIGLTGGIASGKTTVAQELNSRGLLVIDADQLVKEVYKKDEIVQQIKNIDPKFLINGKINFPSLRQWAFQHPENKEKLEGLIYPHLPEKFLEKVVASPDSKTVVYDVPLLFEKSLFPLVDLSVCVYIPPNLQRERLIKRDKIDLASAQKILESQMSIDDKASRSDYVIENSQAKEELKKNIDQFVETYFEK